MPIRTGPAPLGTGSEDHDTRNVADSAENGVGPRARREARRGWYIDPLRHVLPVVLIVEVAALPAVVAASHNTHLFAHVNEGVRGLASGLFLAAGVLRLAQTRIWNDPRLVPEGIAYVVVAIGYPLSWAVAPVHADHDAELLSPLVRMVCFVIAISIFWAASGNAAQRFRPRRAVVISSALIGASLAALVTVHAATGRPLDPSTGAYVALQLGLGAGWTLVAVRTYRQYRRGLDEHWASAAALPLALLALADVTRSLAAVDLMPWVVAAGAVRLTAAAIATVTGTVWFQQAIKSETVRRLSAERALTVTERLLNEDERRHSQQRHDATSVIFGVHLAWSALESRGGALTEETRSRLRSQSLGELTRLQEIIGRPELESLEPVRLPDVLFPVVAAGRNAGREVDVDVRQSVVLAHAQDLQVVVQTLIAGHPMTGHEHITLTAERRDGHIDLAVDVGAGRPRLAANGRGSHVDGGGEFAFGYYTCDRLMREMHGELFEEGAGRFVLSLRAAGSPEQVERTVEIPDATDARSPTLLADPLIAPTDGHRVDHHDETRIDAGRNAAVVHDGEVDAGLTDAVACPDLDAPGSEDARQRVDQQRRLRRDDGRKLPASWHDPSDARAAAVCIPQEVERT